MGFLSAIGRAMSQPGFGDRLQAALAAAGGDPNAIYRLHETQRQNAELAIRQRTEQRAEEDAANQVWGMKSAVGPDGQPMYDNAQIAAMNPEDRSHSMAAAINPYILSAGQSRYGPHGGGRPADVVTAPTTEQQQASWLDSVKPGMGDAFAQRTAYGPPVAIQQGGGLAVNGPDGYRWGVAPDGVSTTPQAPGAPPPTGGAARNNPGGLRYPGSPQFRSFPTQQAGISAQEGQLGRYMGRGINSIQAIVETYAPRRSRGGDNTDEQVNNYVARVSRRLGIDPNQPLSAADIPRVAAAMREVETGRRGTIPGIARAPRLPVQVNTPQEAAALPPGTRFRTPDGREGTRN